MKNQYSFKLKVGDRVRVKSEKFLSYFAAKVHQNKVGVIVNYGYFYDYLVELNYEPPLRELFYSNEIKKLEKDPEKICKKEKTK